MPHEDPTRSKTLRKEYSAACYKRFRRLKGLIREGIAENDALRLGSEYEDRRGRAGSPGVVAAAGNGTASRNADAPSDFPFDDDSDKVDEFLDWLNDAEDSEILEVVERDGRRVVERNAWQNTYVRSSYEKGVRHADDALRENGIDVPEDAIDDALRKPKHADAVGTLYTRNFKALEGITDAVDREISRVLAEGMGEGVNPREMASRLNDRVDSVGVTRARTMARTEVVNAHSTATLNRYEEYDVDEVEVQAEFVTARDGNVCDICKPYHGSTYDLEYARKNLKPPLHPNCRCTLAPKTS